jgi:hypothetical protein
LNGSKGRVLLTRVKKTLLLSLALAAGWLLWTVGNAISWAVSTHEDIRNILRWSAVEGPAGFIVSGLLFLGYARMHRFRGWRSQLLRCAAMCFVGGIAWTLLTGHAAALLDRLTRGWTWVYTPTWQELFLRGGVTRGLILAFFSLLYFAVDYWQQYTEQLAKAHQAAALAQQAQLQMLRYQLNPHFLFNALNSIRAMIVEDQGRARQMVTELAEFLRYSLDGRGQESTIGEEIQAIESFLAIQRIRFEERLEVKLRVDPEADSAVVPCFLIHPLVENAVKYGMQTSAMPLKIAVEVKRRENDLSIRVANTGRLLSGADGQVNGPDGTGTGLKNIAQRLRLAFGERHSFRVFESDGWVRAEIEVPLDVHEANDEAAQSVDRR